MHDMFTHDPCRPSENRPNGEEDLIASVDYEDEWVTKRDAVAKAIAEFIAHAREDIPALLAALAETRAELDKIRASYEDMCAAQDERD